MKRYIKSSDYVPDMTQRLPEGNAPIGGYVDDMDWPDFTLGPRIELYIDEAEEGHFYDTLTIQKADNILYEGDDLNDALAWAKKTGYYDAIIDSSYWNNYNYTITFTLRR